MIATAAGFRFPSFGRRARSSPRALPPLAARLALARAGLIVIVVLAASLVIQLTIVSSFQQRSDQQRKFDQFRSDLANGVAPIGPTDNEGRPVPPGAPVAYLEIPSIGLRQVVVEGTTAENLLAGPGHRRDTPLPGQVGTSLVAGRRSTYGGPFSRIATLERGAVVQATTGQGVFEYRVIGSRAAGDPLPPPFARGSGRLVLATADGRPFVPSGVRWVDADLVGPAVSAPGGRPAVTALAPEEQLGRGDARTLWALALWLQLLIALVVAAIWAWFRWDRTKAWLVFVPPLLLVGLAVSGEAAKLLPNVL